MPKLNWNGGILRFAVEHKTEKKYVNVVHGSQSSLVQRWNSVYIQHHEQPFSTPS